MKEYRIAENFVILEKPRLANNARGWMIVDSDGAILEIKQNLSNDEKALTFFHELTHFAQMGIELETTEADMEEAAELCEEIVARAVCIYPPLMSGLLQILQFASQINKGGKCIK